MLAARGQACVLGVRLCSRALAPRAPAAAAPHQLSVRCAQTFSGPVVSISGRKSVVVLVSRSVAHPVYRKRMTVSKRFMVHDEDESAKLGDVVSITQCRPMSATKRFALAAVVKRADLGEGPLPSETGALA